MKNFLKTTTTIFLFLIAFTSKASHIAGGEITYTCLGNNQYRIHLNLFVDCAGFNPGANQTINFTSTCGGTATTTVAVTPNTTTGLEISQLCPGQMPQSRCNGGTLPGMWLFQYEGVVTLAPPCDTWKMSWSTCCRNSAITNLTTASSNYFIEATLNSVTALCNSSPKFNAQPIPYVCANQPVSYSYGVTEPDGDSLHYQLIPALTAVNTPATYNNPYSGTSPIPGITINPTTGQINFTPTTLGNFVVVILVTEYNRQTKRVKGTVMRDIQFVVLNCTNIVPDPASGTIANLNAAGALQTSPTSLEMCAGDNFCFEATYTDSNANDSLSYVSNILTALPGATVTKVGSGNNPLTLRFCWTAPAGSQGTNPTFTVTVSDNACPLMGQQTFVYYVNVLHATIAGPDQTICGSQSAQIQATGGTIFNWSVLSGDPITPANFSCNPCSNPRVTPSVTTTYQVVSNLSGTCKNIDTITINVVSDFNYQLSQSSSNSCLQQPIQLDVVNITPAAPGYTYKWKPAIYLNNDSIANPVATFTLSGTYTFTVAVTSPAGCTKIDSLTITVVPTVTPTITAHKDTIFCAGGIANLGLNFTHTNPPATCGLSTTGGCGGNGSIITIGKGTSNNSTTLYPAPYGGYYKSAKQQFLFTASELLSAGVVPGKIDRLDFYVTNTNGSTTYNSFSIKMGCTNVTSLASWQTGLVQVFNPKTVIATTAWNNHVFDNAFLWDGLSNIVIETCFDNLSNLSGINNCASPYEVTSFNSCLYYRSNTSLACNITNSYTTTNRRPNIRLSNCNNPINPASYSYAWLPASGNITNASVQNTTGQPSSTTTYTVTVTDIAGGCTATDTVNVTIINITSVTITPVNPLCVNASPINLTSSAPAGLGTWSGPGITNPNTGTFDPGVAGAGLHQVIFTVNAGCGNAADTIDITVIPLPDATITVVPYQCVSGTTYNLTAATAGGNWTGTGISSNTGGVFDPAIAGVGTHLITYTLTTPCTSVDTIIVTVVPQKIATITQAGPFCTGAPSVNLSAVDPNGVWTGTGITNANSGTFDPAVAGAGSHLITYTIAGLCGDMDTMIINVIPSPIISFTTDKTEGCEPTTIIFTSTSNQTGGTCFWDFGDGGTSTNCNPAYAYQNAGTYTVSFTYSNTIGCSTTISQNNLISIHPQPVAGYHATPQPTTIVDPLVQFTDQSTGQVNTWSWDFGGLGTSNISNPYIVYPDTGSYPFQLIVSNQWGCTDTLNDYIVIRPIVTFYAPNGFTPNGNGVNDVFLVYADGIDRSTFEMVIFDRWGEIVFKSNNIYYGWNGSMNNSGKRLTNDVYVWKVKFIDFAGEERNHFGHITLIR